MGLFNKRRSHSQGSAVSTMNDIVANLRHRGAPPVAEAEHFVASVVGRVTVATRNGVHPAAAEYVEDKLRLLASMQIGAWLSALDHEPLHVELMLEIRRPGASLATLIAWLWNLESTSGTTAFRLVTDQFADTVVPILRNGLDGASDHELWNDRVDWPDFMT